ncbi:MAG: RNA polymerase subunit sigma [Planctomycetaceae bacterium]|nr:RNA polymerase subunit sigma [Planctomycetaceae bacterium]
MSSMNAVDDTFAEPVSDSCHVPHRMPIPVNSTDLPGNELIVLLYAELRDLAESRLARESPGQTLQATALVHEVFLKIGTADHRSLWRSRAQFFAAAAEAMRRILIDRARQKQTQKQGGDWKRIEFCEAAFASCGERPEQMLLLEEALIQLQAADETAGRLAGLILFSGLDTVEASVLLGLSRTEGYRQWAFARAFLLSQMSDVHG